MSHSTNADRAYTRRISVSHSTGGTDPTYTRRIPQPPSEFDPTYNNRRASISHLPADPRGNRNVLVSHPPTDLQSIGMAYSPMGTSAGVKSSPDPTANREEPLPHVSTSHPPPPPSTLYQSDSTSSRRDSMSGDSMDRRRSFTSHRPPPSPPSDVYQPESKASRRDSMTDFPADTSNHQFDPNSSRRASISQQLPPSPVQQPITEVSGRTPTSPSSSQLPAHQADSKASRRASVHVSQPSSGSKPKKFSIFRRRASVPHSPPDQTPSPVSHPDPTQSVVHQPDTEASGRGSVSYPPADPYSPIHYPTPTAGGKTHPKPLPQSPPSPVYQTNHSKTRRRSSIAHPPTEQKANRKTSLFGRRASVSNPPAPLPPTDPASIVYPSDPTFMSHIPPPSPVYYSNPAATSNPASIIHPSDQTFISHIPPPSPVYYSNPAATSDPAPYIHQPDSEAIARPTSSHPLPQLPSPVEQASRKASLSHLPADPTPTQPDPRASTQMYSSVTPSVHYSYPAAASSDTTPSQFHVHQPDSKVRRVSTSQPPAETTDRRRNPPQSPPYPAHSRQPTRSSRRASVSLPSSPPSPVNQPDSRARRRSSIAHPPTDPTAATPNTDMTGNTITFTNPRASRKASISSADPTAGIKASVSYAPPPLPPPLPPPPADPTATKQVKFSTYQYSSFTSPLEELENELSTCSSQEEEGSALPPQDTYRYTFLTCKPGNKNLFPPLQGKNTQTHSSPLSLPPYYYVTLNPAPGASIEEYNVASSAFPLSTVHRLE